MPSQPAGDPPVVPCLTPVAVPSARRAPELLATARRVLSSGWFAFTSLAAAAVAYAGGWTRGALLIDGPGIAIYVRLALDHLLTYGHPSYWLPEMWTGTPVWALGPSFPVLLLVPVAALFGSVTAVKLAILAFQVVGAWGAYVLARSLWHHVPAALVAGVVYGLNPVVISHGALAGSESSIGVVAATPWLVWSLRRGIRGDGTRYLVVAGLVAAFAVLHQAEYSYGLALLCACMVGLEAARARQGLPGASLRTLLGRVALVGAVTLGAIAHWLLPFLALHKSFVLSPPDLVHGELLRGIGNVVGRELGVFLHRSSIHGVVSGNRIGLITHVLYLGRVAVAMSCLTTVLVARRRGDRTLSATLLVSILTVWMSTGAASLATGGPVERGQWLPMAVVGVVAGAALGGFLRRTGLRRARSPALVVVAAVFFVAPYLSPLTILQKAVPFLAAIRFPRFYVLAVLGLALGTAWPVAHVAELRPWGRALPAALGGVLALVVAGAVVVDAWPFRSFYRLKSPADAAAYERAATTLADRPPGSRLSPDSLEPRIMTALMRTGADLTLGWPHPVAGSQVWRLTVDALLAPSGYAYGALGVSGTSYLVIERPEKQGTAQESVPELQVLENPRNLPRARAYDQTLVVSDDSIAPELAVAMAHRNVGVVVGGARERRAVAATALPSSVPPRPCDAASVAALPADLAGEAGIACAMEGWLSTTLVGRELFGVDQSPGAAFVSPVGGLRGVSVWFADSPGKTELVVHEVAPDGRSLGREVARAQSSDTDEFGMKVFSFDPLADSAGKRYVFELRFQCPDCFAELAPQVFTGRDRSGAGNLLLNGRLRSDHALAFAPVYQRVPPAPLSSTQVEARQREPGSWRLRTSGSRPALVVLAEANFPGWRARVDGRPAPVLRADGAFLGVAVGPGDHQIALDYHAPPAAAAGRLTTAATLVAIVAAWARSRRRRRGHALEVRAPSGQPLGEELLGPGQDRPRPTVAGRQGPRPEGDEAVLAAFDDSEPGRLDHPQERRGGEP